MKIGGMRDDRHPSDFHIGRLCLFRYSVIPMKAFIFDFDGVIVDSERHWKENASAFFPTIIPHWTPTDSGRMTGLGLQAGHELLMREYGLTMNYDEYMNHRTKLSVDANMEERIQIVPGIPALLDRLVAEDIPIAIGSSAHRPWIDRMLALLELTSYFPLICCANDVDERVKPAPDIYLLVAEKLKVDPKDCVVLEDSFYGVTAAKAAGMYCIGYRYDSNHEQNLDAADRIIATMDQLTTGMLRSL